MLLNSWGEAINTVKSTSFNITVCNRCLKNMQFIDNKSEKFEVVDVLNDREHLVLFLNFLNKIKEVSPNDLRLENYKRLASELDQYLSMNVVYCQSEIIAFSGLQKGYFSNNIARCLARTYYSPKYRVNHMKGHELPGLATKTMLPLQVARAKQEGLSAIFVSMEGGGFRRKYFETIFSKVNELFPYMKWTVLEGRYNTCRIINGNVNDVESCWQNIAILNFVDGYELELPHQPRKIEDGK